jgi:hypothetical protein
MKLKNQLLLATGCGLLMLASCQNPKDQIIGKWQFDSFEAPAMDSVAQVRKKAIDTISHVDSAMASFLGTRDLDSIKAILKKHAEDYKQQQKDVAAMSSVTFLKTGEAIFHNGMQNDTSKWEIIGKDKLVLSPYNDKQRQAGAKEDTATIESISKDKIRLKAPQGNNALYINLRAYTKEDSLKAEDLMKKQQQMMQEQMQQMQQQAPQPNGK